jgi:hypothetical protein
VRIGRGMRVVRCVLCIACCVLRVACCALRVACCAWGVPQMFGRRKGECKFELFRNRWRRRNFSL